MTELRQEALQILETVPETALPALILLMKRERRKYLTKEERIAENREAFQRILKFSENSAQQLPDDFDEKKSLEENLREKYEL